MYNVNVYINWVCTFERCVWPKFNPVNENLKLNPVISVSNDLKLTSDVIGIKNYICFGHYMQVSVYF